MLLLIVLVFTLNGITTHKVSSVSPLDENQWIDHLIRGSNFEIAHSGDRVTDEAVREFCVRGGLTLPRKHPPCDANPIRAERYGFYGGVNIAGHTPFYFLITGPVARALRATPLDLPPNDSIVTWARLLGSVWLLIGWYLVLRIGDLLGVTRRWLVVALVFLSATPALLHASTIVNPDQTAVTTGAAVLLAVVAWEKRGRGLLWVGLAALVAAAFDPTNSVAVVVALAYLAFRAAVGVRSPGSEDTRPWTSYATVCGLLIVAAVIGNQGWDHIGHWFSTPSPVAGVDLSKNPVAQQVSLGAKHLTAGQLFGPRTVFSMFPPFGDGAIIHTARLNDAYLMLAQAAEFLAIAAMLAVVLRDSIVKRIGSLGFALVLAFLVTPSIFVLRDYWVGGTYLPPVARYGLSAMPALAIVIATCARTRFSRGALAILTAGLYLVAIYVVL